jgi:hypothetical protein
MGLTAQAGEWSGHVGSELLAFWRDPLENTQHNTYLSVVAQPEYYAESDDATMSFRFIPFQRVAQHDGRWTHNDIRELSTTYVSESWEATVGVSKVFWGVTEVRHLVDIVNQTDLVENEDGEEKLGQPMAKLSLVRGGGMLDLFVLPLFRDRTFHGKHGRPRLPVAVDVRNPIFTSSKKRSHVDFAARWFQSLGGWEVGLSHFYGTSREPVLVEDVTAAGAVKLRPRYDIIHQTGLEAQLTTGGWLLKFEGIRRTGQGPSFVAIDTGFEYTFSPLASGLEIGALMEYLYDGRADVIQSSISGELDATVFQHDLFVGTRLTFNDVQSTQLLAGAIADLEGGAKSYNIEASRRVGESWLLAAEMRGVFDTEPGDLLYSRRKDQSLRVTLDYYF